VTPDDRKSDPYTGVVSPALPVVTPDTVSAADREVRPFEESGGQVIDVRPVSMSLEVLRADQVIE
jgi:hypothetical protein